MVVSKPEYASPIYHSEHDVDVCKGSTMQSTALTYTAMAERLMSHAVDGGAGDVSSTLIIGPRSR